MFRCQMIENIESILCFHQHQQPILVLKNKQLRKDQRLVCQICIENAKEEETLNIQAIPFRKAIEYVNQIQEKLQEQKINKIQPYLQEIHNFELKLNEIQSSISIAISKLIEITKDWKKQLIQARKNYDSYSFIEEIDIVSKSSDSILKEEEEEINKYIEQLNENYSGKIDADFINLTNLVINSKNKINLLNIKNQKKKNIAVIEQEKNDNIQPNQKNIEYLKLVSYEEICNVNYTNFCSCLSFNYLGDLLFVSQDKEIAIWEINKQNQLNQLSIQSLKVQKHEKEIRCLISSKQMNQFFTGGYDSQIICWKEMEDKQWMISSYKKHQEIVTCLLLNQQENQLISSSFDHQIIIWKLNCKSNKLDYQYSLQNHTDCVYSISLNQSQSELVSSGSDNLIIIWFLDQNQIWQIKQIIENKNKTKGQRINFFGDETLIQIENSYGICQVYEKYKDIYVEKSEKNIQLNSHKQLDLDNVVAIYNKHAQLLIVKYCKYIYFIQKQDDQTFRKVYKPIEFQDDFNYFGISNDARLLITWDSVSKKLKCYKINYE
ncbi:unnamed protein product [Paramecium sonneborni]|uniref:WD40-repeat-containing domain n=1 Tax=Paramecium sonneborni TaxID=65129 RepID=A0A8S1MGT2_9CILI|nr:unnamed protein product [Paramecium sonneborni]